MKTTIHSIILKSVPYKENDALITLYSLEYGKLTLHARGVKKMTSKNAPSVLPMTYSELEVDIRQGLSNLVRGQVLNYYKNIKKSIECEIIANYLLEYYYRYIDVNEPDFDYYDFLFQVLNALENGYSFLVIYALIQCFIIKHNGIMLEVDGCVVCGDTHIHSFSIDKGGFVCGRHVTVKDLHLSKEELQALRYIYKCPISKIDQLHIKIDLKNLYKLFNHYIDEYCGIHLKTKVFIESIL